MFKINSIEVCQYNFYHMNENYINNYANVCILSLVIEDVSFYAVYFEHELIPVLYSSSDRCTRLRRLV